ncbi:MAG: sodium:alanine symporter family protein [Vicinamibacterales bacterium]|jgi:AGCS family alanine or glycine:cation symporter|nr:sodium:alanine symporter family protein [Acidobacteriota bacterium]MDP7671941.1 sodium:alanine symporter family protein [Vicinamibacterales bacterium]HJO39307.1 sodium:alanine symporter family protein [Vicinamibacterales bacterium]
MEDLTNQILAVNDFVYQPMLMPAVLLLVGALISVKTGLVQIRRFPVAVRTVFAGAFQKGGGTDGTITPFQALSTALASTVGNGNIGGVATAILIGGPGAIFWMWVCAAVGMATKYAEAILGVHYRVTRENGELAAGPMYYITGGIKNQTLAKPLAYAFAFFGAVTALVGTGNMAQSNTVARTFVEAASTIFGLEVALWVPGLLITVCVGLVLLGGIQRIAAVAETLVPSMIVLYVATATIYILMNLTQLPAVFGLILSRAFSPSAAAGGFIGASVAQAVAAGISRGVLSNEAGLGSAPIAHGIAKVNHPAEQGVVGLFEVFVDTILVCSMTAFIILSSGLWTDPAYQASSGDLTAAALSTNIPFASLIVALCSFLFGFSTLIGWYYYGEKCFEFMFGSKMIMPYRMLFTALVMVGAVISVPVVWAIGTLLNGFMAFPNLIGLVFLVGTVKKLTTEYFQGGANA